jgi:hypothetical protein
VQFLVVFSLDVNFGFSELRWLLRIYSVRYGRWSCAVVEGNYDGICLVQIRNKPEENPEFESMSQKVGRGWDQKALEDRFFREHHAMAKNAPVADDNESKLL